MATNANAEAGHTNPKKKLPSGSNPSTLPTYVNFLLCNKLFY